MVAWSLCNCRLVYNARNCWNIQSDDIYYKVYNSLFTAHISAPPHVAPFFITYLSLFKSVSPCFMSTNATMPPCYRRDRLPLSQIAYVVGASLFRGMFAFVVHNMYGNFIAIVNKSSFCCFLGTLVSAWMIYGMIAACGIMFNYICQVAFQETNLYNWSTSKELIHPIIFMVGRAIDGSPVNIIKWISYMIAYWWLCKK